MAPWSLDQAYTAYPAIEAEFEAALDASLAPRGPGLLFELAAGLALPGGSTAVDVGCGEGRQAIELGRRFGFRVAGIDPVPSHVAAARAAAGPGGPCFSLGTAEHLPVASAAADLVWCRDVLVHVADLRAAYAEFRRVLRPGGRAAYDMMLADCLWHVYGMIGKLGRRAYLLSAPG